MKGLVEEGKEIIDSTHDEATGDAGLIAAAQKVEHYEIASYGCLITWAQHLGLDEAVRLLQQTLGEEKAADEKLTGLAEQHINAEAEKMEEDEEGEEGEEGEEPVTFRETPSRR